MIDYVVSWYAALPAHTFMLYASLFGAFVVFLAVLAEDSRRSSTSRQFDLRQFDTTYVVQNAASCTGEAIVAAYENMLAQRGPEYAAKLSAYAAWYWCRAVLYVESRSTGGNASAGIRFMHAQEIGLPLESTHRSRSGNELARPPRGPYFLLYTRRIELSADALIAELSLGRPIVVNMVSQTGMHAVCVVAYVQESGRFIYKGDISSKDGYGEFHASLLGTEVFEPVTFDIPADLPVANKFMRFAAVRAAYKIWDYISGVDR